MKNRHSDKILSALIFFWALLAGYFAFNDLQTSILIVNENSGWARFVQNFGEIPGLIVLLSGTYVYASSIKLNTAVKKYIALPFLFIASVFLLRYLIIVTSHGLTGDYQFAGIYKIYLFLLSFIVNVVIFYLLVKRIATLPANIYLFGKIAILLGIFGYLLYVQPFKLIWGRVRFRDLDGLYSNFTQWYVINGPNGNSSFPSGHAAMAWMILPLILLAANKSKAVKTLLLSLIILWGIFVSAGRVVIGAHYISDVLFSSMWIIVCFLYMLKKLNSGQTVSQEESIHT